MHLKKLCLVIPSLQAGGMERVMSELASNFAERSDLKVHIVLYGITRELFYPLRGEIIIHTPAFRFNNSLRVFSTMRTMLYLRTEIRKISPDVILSFGEYWNSFVLITLKLLPYRIYISDRCQPDKVLGKLHDWLRKKLYPGASGIIVQTKKAEEIYRSEYKNRNIHTIGNPVRSIATRSNVQRENIILTVGRLIKSKNHDKLIEIFIRISKPDWKLVIVGYDHLKQNVSENLFRIIRENRAEDRIILAGKQTDVESFYLQSKIFAFTSDSEGFPNVIGEAMAAGLPVIAFDCIAGPSEMIENDKNGILVPLYDYRTFEGKLNALMDDPDLRTRLGEQARVDIRRFSIDVIAERYINVLTGE